MEALSVRTLDLRPGDVLVTADSGIEEQVVDVEGAFTYEQVVRVNVLRSVAGWSNRPAFFYSGVDAVHQVIR